MFPAVAGVPLETSQSIKPRERDLGDLHLFFLVRILTRPTDHPRHAACASNHQSKPVRPLFLETELYLIAAKKQLHQTTRSVKFLARNPTVRDELPMADLQDFKGSVALVVSSCDAFFDAWQPFNAFLRKFWPDCPLDIFLVTNEFEIRSSRIRALRLGKDRGWSSNFLRALEQIRHPYLLYLQEDYFLTAPVNETQMAQDFAKVMELDADSLCFRARRRNDPEFQPLNDRFGLVPLNSDGRTRCQVTLWKRSALQSILRLEETAWNFEARGSARTQAMKILSYTRRDNTPIPYLMSAISRGLWMPDALTLCREHGIAIEAFFRPLFSPRPWQRRLRRAIGRARFRHALRTQQGKPIELP
jgi:hypothetical protein